MPSGGLSAEVAAFLAAHIDSVPQMEALLLLYEERAQAWTAAQVATRIYTDTTRAAALLRHLHQQRLVETLPDDGEARFRYDPGWDGAQLMNGVAIAYRTQLIAVTSFIHAKASPSILDFARAFDLKKDR